MKFTSLFTISLALQSVQSASSQWYPLDKKGSIPKDIESFNLGEEIPLDCISRNIENGEHKFDDQERIIYQPFPKCKETGKPLNFKYGINEDINCTIGFTDELYHLFQLYIHEDAPFSCRLPISSESNSIEKGGASIPLTFNFRGEIHDSHLDIDNHLNVLFSKALSQNSVNSIISSVAWSSGTNATRVVIGDYVTLNLAVRWLDHLKNAGSTAQEFKYADLPYNDGFYKLPTNSIPMSYSMFCFYLVVVSLATSAIILAFSYNFLSLKFSKNNYRSLDNESFVAKRD